MGNPMKDYKPFISQGYVSFNDSTDKVPVQIVRDTGASQTLLLDGILPLSEKSSMGGSVLLQGVGLGIIDVPLHRIHLNSDLISGPVVVGVRPNLPIQGVSVLLGNDLAGGKVVAGPIVCQKALPDTDSDDEELYPSCVVTRAMSRKLQTTTDDSQESTKEASAQNDDINLSETSLYQSDLTSDSPFEDFFQEE